MLVVKPIIFFISNLKSEIELHGVGFLVWA